MKLPKACKEANCLECQWSRGAIKHYCPKNGGDAEFEASGKSFGFKEFSPYVLKDGDFKRLDKSDFCKDGKVHVQTQAQEDAVFKKLNVHRMEPMEKVMGVTMEMNPMPKEKIYSILKGN